MSKKWKEQNKKRIRKIIKIYISQIHLATNLAQDWRYRLEYWLWSPLWLLARDIHSLSRMRSHFTWTRISLTRRCLPKPYWTFTVRLKRLDSKLNSLSITLPFRRYVFIYDCFWSILSTDLVNQFDSVMQLLWMEAMCLG